MSFRGVVRSVLPRKVVVQLKAWRSIREPKAEWLSSNAVLRGRHEAARCFILCTGPSVLKQDLRRLAGELVISASSAYLHPHFSVFRPAYHCVPHLTYAIATESHFVRWFDEMDRHLGGAELFLSSTERTLVMSKKLFADRRVHYLSMSGDVVKSEKVIPDLADTVAVPQSVPIMALMLALYLGCKTIYLLGTEHDHFLTGQYVHFYDRSPLTGTDPSVNTEGRIVGPLYDELHALARLWGQYRWLRNCAAAAGAQIFNATAGGALDEFQRMDFESLRLAGD